jgi:alkylation response protein AidB-like acyl-CoA dehydrogenase
MDSPDQDAVLAEVDRFATRWLEPRCVRPELPLTSRDLDATLVEARTLGIVATADPGLGLWEDLDDTLSRSLRVLVRIARANAGVALAFHLESLARVLLRRLGFEAEGPGLAAVFGRYGIGRSALARFLAGVQLDEDDRALLLDVFGASDRLVTGHDGFSWLLWPAMEDRGTVRWCLTTTPTIRRHPHAHGFDELATFSVRPGMRRMGTDCTEETANRALFAEALTLHALGLVAIALGSAQRAHGLARSFAATRRQGGKTIDGHPAVQLLLASSRGAITSVEGSLEALGQRSIRGASIGRVFSVRAEAHPLLCRGANDALQVFGGMGYMRDVGLEKVVRDLNHLRALGGSPPELALFVSAWEMHGG